MKLYAIRRIADGQWYRGVNYARKAEYGSKPKFYRSKNAAKTNFISTGAHLTWNPKTQKYETPHEIVTFNVTIADVESISQGKQPATAE